MPRNDRYTNAGDTVASLSAERHNVVEGALERSRRVEVFVADLQSKEPVKESLEASFSRAYKAGKWKVRKMLFTVSFLCCRNMSSARFCWRWCSR